MVISAPSEDQPAVIQWDMGRAEDKRSFIQTGSLEPPAKLCLGALAKFEAEQTKVYTATMKIYDKCLETTSSHPSPRILPTIQATNI